MRFRGKIVDIGCIQHFSRVVNTIAKLAKTCVLRLTASKIFFILSERLVNGGVSIWCELPQKHVFNEYQIDGVAEDANEIYLELSPDNLVRVMRTAQNAKSLKVKLTKKHSPCLTLEVELPSLASSLRTVVHDVPVVVLPRRHWNEFEEPEMPNFDVSIYMPPLKQLRNMVDRMKNLSNFVVVSANQSGEMKLKVETDLVTAVTHFKDLDHPTWTRESDGAESQSSQKDREPAEFAETRIDIRKFAQFLSSQQVNPVRVICNIVDDQVVHFYLLHEDLSLQYFMPVVAV